MVEIANFSSLLEISVALHLAYSFLADIKNYPFRGIEKHLAYVKEKRYRFSEMDTEQFEFAIAKLEREITWMEYRIEPYIGKFVKASFIVALASTFLLLFAGFQPDAKLPYLVMAIILAFVLLPMPAFVFITRKMSQSAANEARKVHSEVHQAFKSLIEEKVDSNASQSAA